MDNSFEKFNKEFAGKAKFGFKEKFALVWSYIFGVIGFGFGIVALFPNCNTYLSLATLLFGLFGCQCASKAKGVSEWSLKTRIPFFFCIASVAFACVVLYIVLPYSQGK